MRPFLIAWFVSLLVSFGPAAAWADDSPACTIPSDLAEPSAPLTNVAAALASKGGLNILALGSGSTVGDSGTAAGPALAYTAHKSSFPYKMVDTLRELRPAMHFDLTVAGGRSMTANTMLPILREELAAHHYDLVLWQTGTVEAVQGLRPDVLRADLQEGADAAAEAHADVVLIDPQFSRFLRANADISPYETVLAQMTTDPGVTLFHRFDLTQSWVNSGEVDLERVSRDQRDQTISALNECLGQALARYILTGGGEH